MSHLTECRHPALTHVNYNSFHFKAAKISFFSCFFFKHACNESSGKCLVCGLILSPFYLWGKRAPCWRRELRPLPLAMEKHSCFLLLNTALSCGWFSCLFFNSFPSETVTRTLTKFKWVCIRKLICELFGALKRREHEWKRNWIRLELILMPVSLWLQSG